MKLRRPRQIVPPTRIAYMAVGGARGANVVIPIEGLDPRVIVAIHVWVKRATDSSGSSGTYAAVSSGVTWSIYSAIKGADTVLRAMTYLPGFQDRAIRPADAWGDDGVLRSGDSAEISASSPVMVAIRQADVYAVMGPGAGQEIWFTVEAYPSDAIPDTDQEGQESYRGLLEQVSCPIPAEIRIGVAPA